MITGTYSLGENFDDNVESFGNPFFSPTGVDVGEIVIPYISKGGQNRSLTLPVTFPTPASAIGNYDLKIESPSEGVLKFTVEGEYIDDNGVTQSFGDSEEISVNGSAWNNPDGSAASQNSTDVEFNKGTVKLGDYTGDKHDEKFDVELGINSDGQVVTYRRPKRIGHIVFKGSSPPEDVIGGWGTLTENSIGTTFGANGVHGSFASFNRRGSFTASKDPRDGLSEYSMEMWVKPETNSNSYRGIVSTSDNLFSINMVNGDYDFRTGGALYIPFDGNKWQHLVMTYKDGVKNVYIDGVLVRTENLTLNANTSTWYIGSDRGFASRESDSDLSSLTFWDKELCPIKVSELYEDGSLHIIEDDTFNLIEPTVRAYFDFNESPAVNNLINPLDEWTGVLVGDLPDTNLVSDSQIGTSWRFNGNGNYDFAGLPDGIEGRPATISFWLKFDSVLGGYRTPFSMWEDSNLSNFFSINSNNGSIDLRGTQQGIYYIDSVNSISGGTWNANQWYHIVMTYAEFPRGVNSVSINSDRGGTGRRADVSFDEFAIFEGSLTPTQVNALYNKQRLNIIAPLSV